MKSFLVLPALVCAVALSAPAIAADERLVTRSYNRDEVVRIDGRAGVQATIAFGENEHIENVAIGDAEKWQVTPNKRANLLFVKPLGASARTNMTVVTDQHTYFFDLVAAPSARALYMLRFTYPEGVKPQPAATPAAPELALTAAEQNVLGGDTPLDPAALNFDWRHQGSARLRPARIYDDGASTYLQWGADQEMPAVLIRNEKGEEGPVNFAVRGDTLVLDTVPNVIVLRSGKVQALLRNRPTAGSR